VKLARAIRQICERDQRSPRLTRRQYLLKKANVIDSFETLQEDFDVAAAREPRSPGRGIGDTEFEERWPAGRHHVCGLGDDVGLHAASGNRTLKSVIRPYDELPSNGDG
jgi:hypothetical protein